MILLTAMYIALALQIVMLGGFVWIAWKLWRGGNDDRHTDR